MKLVDVRRILLDEGSSAPVVEAALNKYAQTCAEVTGIAPDAGFGAWADDCFLASGIAINPRAAANCVFDHRRP